MEGTEHQWLGALAHGDARAWLRQASGGHCSVSATGGIHRTATCHYPEAAQKAGKPVQILPALLHSGEILTQTGGLAQRREGGIEVSHLIDQARRLRLPGA